MKWIITVILVGFLMGSSAEQEQACPASGKQKTNICLNMIVKDEATVLPRLFESVKDVIDTYVIVDTGSTDETVTLIASEMEKYNMQGHVFEQEWVNFGVNRQQALELALQHCQTE